MKANPIEGEQKSHGRTKANRKIIYNIFQFLFISFSVSDCRDADAEHSSDADKFISVAAECRREELVETAKRRQSKGMGKEAAEPSLPSLDRRNFHT